MFAPVSGFVTVVLLRSGVGAVCLRFTVVCYCLRVLLVVWLVLVAV